jgi:NAD(P)-dependent dehydrogenase (short-subunit alcohol dehydrogenase family)
MRAVSAYFSGKKVFITGAGSGIGYQCALVFAGEGADIIATDVNLAGLERLKPEIEQLRRQCHIHSLDVADEAAYSALVDQLESSGLVPDIVINNAGLGILSPFLETTTADWHLTLNVNVLGVVLGCRLFATIWMRRGMPGHLVNVSSMASISPPANVAAYVASKYAVEGLSEALVMELEEFDIAISCVHPGVINTAIVQDSSRAHMAPSEIARLQRYYVDKGVHPSVVAQDIAEGVRRGKLTILSGEGVGKVALMKRLLPRRLFRKLLIDASRNMGYLPRK